MMGRGGTVIAVFAAVAMSAYVSRQADCLLLNGLNHSIRGPMNRASSPGSHNCTEHAFQQRLDHFSFRSDAGTWPQRYLVYSKYWMSKKGPVFFYGGSLLHLTVFMFGLRPVCTLDLRILMVYCCCFSGK